VDPSTRSPPPRAGSRLVDGGVAGQRLNDALDERGLSDAVATGERDAHASKDTFLTRPRRGDRIECATRDLPHPMELLGTIREIYRYPVKSMAGEGQRAATVGWHGLEGDRRFAFRRIGDTSGFPWLTAGKLPGLLCYRPYYPPADESGRLIRVVTPEGEDLAGDSAELRDRVAASCGGPSSYCTSNTASMTRRRCP